MFFLVACRRTRKLNAELANGRLAMMAIIGMPLALQWGIPYVPYHYLVWEHAFILRHFVLASDFGQFMRHDCSSPTMDSIGSCCYVVLCYVISCYVMLFGYVLTCFDKFWEHCRWTKVFPGWPDWFRLGRLGKLHWLSSAWLGPSGVRVGVKWKRSEACPQKIAKAQLSFVGAISAYSEVRSKAS